MFEPFFTTKGSLGGSGIGLSTVFAIVQEVGGEIDVESTEGVGTRVALRFATIPAEPEAPQVATSSDAETVSGLAVVVEDNHGLNRLVAGYLKALGLDVVTFGGATEARRDWGNVPGQPRILVTDVLLGDGCGLELAEELQQSGAVDKVLVVTGRADTEKVEAMMQRYGWYLLMKPFRRAQLRERVLGLLRESASS